MPIEPILAADLLAPNFGLIIWITLVFLLLLIVLRRFAWGPITSALDERERTIDESIQRAETALAEARQIQADNERARREAEQEAQKILREAREVSERIRTEEVEKTREQIRRMQQSAREEIAQEKEGALSELRSEVADLAIQAAEKILKESLDETRQRKLVANFIETLPRN